RLRHRPSYKVPCGDPYVGLHSHVFEECFPRQQFVRRTLYGDLAPSQAQNSRRAAGLLGPMGHKEYSWGKPLIQSVERLPKLMRLTCRQVRRRFIEHEEL